MYLSSRYFYFYVLWEGTGKELQNIWFGHTMYGYFAFYLIWSITCCLVSESSISKVNKSFYNANCILVVLYLLLLALILWKHDHTICHWLEFNSRWLTTKSWKRHGKNLFNQERYNMYSLLAHEWYCVVPVTVIPVYLEGAYNLKEKVSWGREPTK